jgi:hypothetical protein
MLFSPPCFLTAYRLVALPDPRRDELAVAGYRDGEITVEAVKAYAPGDGRLAEVSCRVKS